MLLAALTFQSFAYDFEKDGIYYNKISNTEVEVTSGTSSYVYRDNIVIPATVSYENITYSVTSIGEEAFYMCSVTSVEIGNSVTSIGKGAFYYCRALTSVEIGNSVTKIGDRAFQYCTNLVSVDFPDSLIEIGVSAFRFDSLLINKLPDSLKIIGETAFQGLKNESIFIPASVEYIGSGAFHSEDLAEINVSPENLYYTSDNGILYNKDLTILLYCPTGKSGSVTIPDSVEEIYGDKNSWLIGHQYIGAFSECKNITSVVFGKNVKSIGYNSFALCTNLSEIIFNDHLVCISGQAFIDCTSLTSIVLPDSLTTVGERVFLGCEKLSSVKLPSNLTYIGEYMFRDCSSLKSIELPESIKYLYDSAFSHCTSLVSIVLPKNVISLDDDAFEECTSMKVIVSLNPIPPSVHPNAFDDTEIYKQAELQVPAHALADYKKADVWKYFWKITPLDVDETLPESIVISGIPDGSIRPSESIQLSAQVLPEDAFSQSVVWSSSKTSVASVTQDGFVIAISPGTTTITVYVEDYPEISASCDISVSLSSNIEDLPGDDGGNISIYSLDGLLIKKDCKTEDLKLLDKGIYIIVSGKERYKISI